VLHVEGTRTLQLAAAAFGRAPREVRAAIRDTAKGWAPLLRNTSSQYAAMHPRNPDLALAVARSAKLTSNTRGLVATFGASGTFRGEPLRNLAAPFEFGGNQQKYEQYIARHRKSRTRMYVERRAQAQIPKRRRQGYYIYPAVAVDTPRLVAAWIKTIIDATTDGRRYAG